MQQHVFFFWLIVSLIKLVEMCLSGNILRSQQLFFYQKGFFYTTGN
jgi:hypothetical protein